MNNSRRSRLVVPILCLLTLVGLLASHVVAQGPVNARGHQSYRVMITNTVSTLVVPRQDRPWTWLIVEVETDSAHWRTDGNNAGNTNGVLSAGKSLCYSAGDGFLSEIRMLSKNSNTWVSVNGDRQQ